MAERPTHFDVAIATGYMVVAVVEDVPRERVGRVIAGIMRGDGDIEPFDGEIIDAHPSPKTRRSSSSTSWSARGPNWDDVGYEREKGRWKAYHVGEFVVDIARDVQKHKKRGGSG